MVFLPSLIFIVYGYCFKYKFYTINNQLKNICFVDTKNKVLRKVNNNLLKPESQFSESFDHIRNEMDNLRRNYDTCISTLSGLLLAQNIFRFIQCIAIANVLLCGYEKDLFIICLELPAVGLVILSFGLECYLADDIEAEV